MTKGCFPRGLFDLIVTLAFFLYSITKQENKDEENLNLNTGTDLTSGQLSKQVIPNTTAL